MTTTVDQEHTAVLIPKSTAESSQTKKSAEKEGNPALGIFFFIVSGFCFALNFIFAKVIYENKPMTTPLQVLAYRSIISTGLMMLKVNKDLKKVCYDTIEGKMWYPLWARTIQGMFTITINFSSIKYFTLTLVAVVNNFGPLFTVILAYFMLDERLNTFKMGQLLFAFGGATLMIVFTPLPETETPQEGDTQEGSLATIFKYVCLVLNPMLVAYGTIQMRKMRSLNEDVVSCYMNGVAIPLMIVLVYATGSDLSAWNDFGGLEWFCIVALSVSVIFSQTFRFKAVQNEEAAKLQPLNFLNPVYQLIGDLAIFSAAFNVWQLVGMAIVCLVFFVELVITWMCTEKKKPKVEDSYQRSVDTEVAINSEQKQ